MPLRLHSVLSAADLPAAELCAARLDGELFQIGDCFSPIDEIELPEHRARVVHSGRSDRLIAEQNSAAWIWGARESVPRHHQLCIGLNSRISHEVHTSVTVREVVIEPREIATIGGFRLTTPLRTVIDIARFSELFDQHERRAVVALMSEHDVTFVDCMSELDSRRNLPGKRRAVDRLSAIGRLGAKD